ncbi:MAG: phosphate acyltransferase PlsX [Alphaproteobacteria bacterium]|nr:phosphate acyltransferase PlsX [Alphaproteobacteria bacterium]
MITVALDTMGSDGGAKPLVEGAAWLSREDGDLSVILVGEEPVLSEHLAELRYDPARLSVVHAEGAVSMEDKPGDALDARPDCSVLTAARLVAEGEADALVSAGNTGAVILAASRTFERLPGIRRGALAAVYPTEQRHGPRQDPFALMLDVGATTHCSAQDLVGFAVMGSAYSRIISDIERPRVALLSNGTEPTKGTPIIVEAHRMLTNHRAVNFVGNVEGLDIPRGTVDVVICDGFLGNVVLKMLEGVSEVVADLARDAYARKFLWKMGLTMLSQGLRQIRTMTDWKQYGGAPVLGFDHVVIKAHGRSNARAVRNALKVAAKAVERGLAQEIASGLTG